jgi:hypothetical protein
MSATATRQSQNATRGEKLRHRTNRMPLQIMLAVMKRDFFPDPELFARWPELVEVHAELERLASVRGEAEAAFSRLASRFLEEDAERERASIEQIRDPAAPAPTGTSSEDRDELLAEATERIQFAEIAYVDVVEEVFATIAERLPDFLADLGIERLAAQAKAEEARRALAEAESHLEDTAKMERWLERAAFVPGSLGPMIWAETPANRPVNVFPTVREPTTEEAARV